MQDLKQSTGIKVRIGPFVDKTDGLTPETGVALSTADEAELLKHDGAATVNIASNTWAAITSCDGWYDLSLTTTDTNTLGQLTVVVQDDSVCLPVFAHFMVLPANVWDSKYSTDKLEVDISQAGGSAIQQAGGYFKVKDDEGNTLANEAKQDIIDGIVDDILTDTGTTLDDKMDTIDGIVDDILVDTGTTLEGHVTDIEADTQDLQTQIGTDGAGLTNLGGMSSGMKAEVGAEATDALNAYDPPTRTEATSDKDAIITEVDANETKIDTVDTVVDAIKAQTDDQPAGIPKGVELTFVFFMVLSSDHITPATSKTIVEEISKDGGAFAACTNTFAEIGNGFYKITLTAAEMNAAVIALKLTETDCDQTSITLVTSA